MTAALPAIQAVVDHLSLASATRSARRRTAGWAATQPLLAPYQDPAAIAEAIASAGPCRQDQLIVAVLTGAGDDQLAQLTVIAGLAKRLQWIVGRWRRAGVPAADLAGMEADLVAECWIAVADLARRLGGGEEPPPGGRLHLVQCAWEAVRGPRRRQLRMAAGQAPMDREPVTGRRVGGRGAGELLEVELVSAVRAGRVNVPAARLVFSTRVAGWTVTETAARLGCSPQSIRTRRARAEHRLTAA